jgi:hypothetical protein
MENKRWSFTEIRRWRWSWTHRIGRDGDGAGSGDGDGDGADVLLYVRTDGGLVGVRWWWWSWVAVDGVEGGRDLGGKWVWGENGEMGIGILKSFSRWF